MAVDTPETRAYIAREVRAGHGPRQIAAGLSLRLDRVVRPSYVSVLLTLMRRDDPTLPVLAPSGRPRGERQVPLRLDAATRNYFMEKSGGSGERELMTRVLTTVARDDMLRAVLDDEGTTDPHP